MTDPGAVPELSEADLTSRLEEIAREGSAARLVALHGRWRGPDVVESTTAGRFEVRAVASELRLRSLVPAPDDERAIAFVVPWTERLPLDLAGRFARDGKVQRVGVEQRLCRMFKARSIGDALRNARHLGQHLVSHAEGPYPIAGNRLTAEVLWDTWLQTIAGAPSHQSPAPLAALLCWALQNGDGAARRDEIDRTPGLRAELEEVLAGRYGPGALAVWGAWERGEAEALLVAAVWMEALGPRAELGVVQYFWKSHIEKPFGVAVGSPDAERLGGCLDALSGEGLAPRALGRACRAAEQTIAAQQMPELDEALGESPRLEQGLIARRDRLGGALKRLAPDPTVARWQAVREALEALAAHRLATERESLIAEAQMAARLAAFLVERSDRGPSDDSPRAELKRLARWFVAEGGYLDWARQRARHAAVPGTLGEGVAAVLAEVDAIRREMDLAFARGLSEWYAAGRAGKLLMPIEKVTAEMAAPFLTEHDDRRLLVLMLDGMSWAQAVELLDGLEAGRHEAAWGLAAWSRAIGDRYEGDFVPVQAAVPTITDISRAGFFAGKAFGPRDRRDTTADDKRFASNAALAKLGEPVLYAKAELSPAGSLTDAIRRKIADRGQRVVGVTINAIDSWLSGDAAQTHAWDPGSIHMLPKLLEAAREAGRAVLMTADHGHVAGARLRYVEAPNKPGGARWRPLEGAVADYEVAFRKPQAWAPPGCEGVALIADDEHRYTAKPNAGEHGGATLAEVLCPTFLLAPEGLAEDWGDDGLRVVGFTRPAWWSHEPATQAIRSTEAVETTAAPLPEEVAARHQSEPPKSKPPTPKPPSVRQKHPLLSSPMFTERVADARRRDQAVAAVEFLRARGGRANGKAFAGALRKRHATLNGFVAELQRIFNQDQASVIRYDGEADQVILEITLLSALFEVDL